MSNISLVLVSDILVETTTYEYSIASVSYDRLGKQH